MTYWNAHPRTATAILVFLCGVIALYLRFPGYDGRPLWHDELWRVNLIAGPDIYNQYLNTPTPFTATTAPTYILINRFLALWGIGPSVMRLSSLIPSVASVILVFYIIRQVEASLLLAAIAGITFAANIEFIRYSNEFKPYMFEVLIHVACIYLWLGIIRADRVSPMRWAGFFLFLAFAILSSANVVFIIPALGISLFWKSLAGHRRSDLKIVIPGFMILGLLMAFLYVFVWSYGSSDGMLLYWANGFVQPSDGNYGNFIIRRLGAMWKEAFSLVGCGAYLSALTIQLTLGILLITAFGRSLFRPNNGAKRAVAGYGFQLFLFSSVFLSTLLALNSLRLWPLGPYRPNLFIYAHVLVMFYLFTCFFHSRLKAKFTWVAKLLYWTLLISMTAGMLKGYSTDGFTPPLERSDLVWQDLNEGKAGQEIQEECKQDGIVTLMVNPGMSLAVTHYRMVDEYRNHHGGNFDGCIEVQLIGDAYADEAVFRERLENQLKTKRGLWLAFNHLNKDEVALMRKSIADHGQILTEASFPESGYFHLTRDTRAH